MNTTTNNNITAPSITIAPRSPANGVLLYVVTITTVREVRSYPCRSIDSAHKLVDRFMAGVVNPKPSRKPATEQPAEAAPVPVPALAAA